MVIREGDDYVGAPEDVEAVHDGVSDVGPVAPQLLPLVSRPLVIFGVQHGLGQHGIDQGGVDWTKQRHALLILLGLAGDDIVLKDVPETKRHFTDSLLQN